MPTINDLKRYLNQNAARLNVNSAKLVALLEACWDSFAGGKDTGMESRKLKRASAFEWTRPILSFRIERHGGTVYGSTRVNIQLWSVDLARKCASPQVVGFRQLKAPSARLDVHSLAAATAASIVASENARSLNWIEPHRVVCVLVGNLIPSEGPKQTLAGRRKKFREELTKILTGFGWREMRANVYSKSGGNEGECNQPRLP